MRLVRFLPSRGGGEPRIGLWTEAAILDPEASWDAARGIFPRDLVSLLADARAHAHCEELLQRPRGAAAIPHGDARLLAPVPRPASFRDFYAFEEHVRAARARRGLAVPEEWYRFPAFYFSNHGAILGPGDPVRAPSDTRALDFELEIGCVIGVGGRDIPVKRALAHVAGFCVLNDWSARDVQREEMAIGLGPAKGKDFATSIGPALVTPDEIADARSGKGYELAMEARVNGAVLTRGSWSTIHWSFEEMIARASRDVRLYPGDLLGSGTVGGGCILEKGPEEAGGWLAPGDAIELTIERLGTLATPVAAGAGG